MPDDLITRIESAGPDEQEKLLLEAYDHCPHAWKGGNALTRFESLLDAEAYVDTALMLMPDGAGVHLDRYWIGSVEYPVWSACISTGGVPSDPRQVFVAQDASTPALALLAAILKAKGPRQCRDFISHQIGSSYSETNKEDEVLLARVDEALSTKPQQHTEDEADGWERGMRDAANICGSLAETTYDDADTFEVATGCEAEIVKQLRMHQRNRTSKPQQQPQEYTKDWCMKMAEQEGDAEIGAGVLHPEAEQPQANWRMQEAMKALEAIRDAWVSNNSEGDDYEEGYDDGLKQCHDIARAALAAMKGTSDD